MLSEIKIREKKTYNELQRAAVQKEYRKAIEECDFQRARDLSVSENYYRATIWALEDVLEGKG